jgi:hypothetical protein
MAPPTETKAELDALAATLAYEFAISTLDGECNDVTEEAGGEGEWHDSSLCDEDMLAYLEARGLLERHASNPAWVQVRDESEATR